ncbi:hypothetical protein ACFL2Q_14800 [Thermodesulfobacteriota bacterium]
MRAFTYFVLAILFACLVLADCEALHANTLTVGPGKMFARIGDAVDRARAGDTILVYPRKGDKPYRKVALLIKVPGLVFHAARSADRSRVRISGKGFNYSGRGRVPRAVFQFNPGADGCVVDGFEIFGAHGEDRNGAAVRINGANGVVVRNCNIHHNDMGIMCGGRVNRGTGKGELIEHCLIHHNGTLDNPGYNHNLYLNGTSVIVRFCSLNNSLSGQNLKSRAHHLRVEYCYIHHSANRELDLVDSVNTALPGSHAVLVGNVIVKAPRTNGNQTVIQFGRDGSKEHNGTLFLVHNTIVTPYVSPIVDLTASKAKVHMSGNIICDGGSGQRNQRLVRVRNGALLRNVGGSRNWSSSGFSLPRGTGLDPKTNLFGRQPSNMFAAPDLHDYRPSARVPEVVGAGQYLDLARIPAVPGLPADIEDIPILSCEYRHPAKRQARPHRRNPDLGAYGVR